MQNNMLEPGDIVTIYMGNGFTQGKRDVVANVRIGTTVNFHAQGEGNKTADIYNQWEFEQKLRDDDPNFPGVKFVTRVHWPESIFYPIVAVYEDPERLAELKRKASNIKPLDIVRIVVNREIMAFSYDGNHIYRDFSDRERTRLAIVKEVKPNGDAHLEWIGDGILPPEQNLYNAWWSPKNLEVVDNLARILTKNMVHPFGEAAKDSEYGNKWYPIK